MLSAYLPPEMDDAALGAVVTEEVEAARVAGHTGLRAMGVVIKAVRARVGTGAEGSRIAELVKKAVSG